METNIEQALNELITPRKSSIERLPSHRSVEEMENQMKQIEKEILLQPNDKIRRSSKMLMDLEMASIEKDLK